VPTAYATSPFPVVDELFSVLNRFLLMFVINFPSYTKRLSAVYKRSI